MDACWLNGRLATNTLVKSSNYINYNCSVEGKLTFCANGVLLSAELHSFCRRLSRSACPYPKNPPGFRIAYTAQVCEYVCIARSSYRDQKLAPFAGERMFERLTVAMSQRGYVFLPSCFRSELLMNIFFKTIDSTSTYCAYHKCIANDSFQHSVSRNIKGLVKSLVVTGFVEKVYSLRTYIASSRKEDTGGCTVFIWKMGNLQK